MNAPTAFFTTQAILPWDETREDRLRLWIPVFLLTLLSVLLIIAIRLAPPVEHERYQPEKIPERLAKFITEQKANPPKPVIKPKVEEPKELKENPEEKTAQAKTEAPTEKPAQKVQPTEKQVAVARAQATQRVAVFEDAFAGLRDMTPDTGVGNGGTGAMAGTGSDLQRGGDQVASLDPGRDLIATAAGSGSGPAALVGAGRASGVGSRGGTGNGRLAGSGGNIGGAVQSSLAQAGAGSSVRESAGGQTRRSDESIRRVFDRYAGRLNSQYQRALRENPTLQGTVVLHLSIDPSGKVTKVDIKSSELADDDLLKRIKLIVSTMDFGALPVAAWTGDYSVNFFPS